MEKTVLSTLMISVLDRKTGPMHHLQSPNKLVDALDPEQALSDSIEAYVDGGVIALRNS